MNDESHLKRGRGRPRRDVDQEVLAATRELLVRDGYASFTTDAVAAGTGIAKTTIYRRWPTKAALVAAAVAQPPRSDDAEAILTETANALDLVADAGGDGLDVLRAIVSPRLEMLRRVLGEEADERIGALIVRKMVK